VVDDGAASRSGTLGNRRLRRRADPRSRNLRDRRRGDWRDRRIDRRIPSLSAVIASLTAPSYAELSSFFPKTQYVVSKSEHPVFPELARVHSSRQTAHDAVGPVGLAAIPFVCLGDSGLVAELANFTLLTVSYSTRCCCNCGTRDRTRLPAAVRRRPASRFDPADAARARRSRGMAATRSHSLRISTLTRSAWTIANSTDIGM